jgi:hypothetical protein
MTLGSVSRWGHNAFSLAISCVLEIAEPKGHKCNCKSACIRPLFLYRLPDIHIPAKINKKWQNVYNSALPKTL